MARRNSKGDVTWHIPKRKRPLAYSTQATSDLIAALSTKGRTIREVYAAITYDVEAKHILQLYIDKGYGDEAAENWFR